MKRHMRVTRAGNDLEIVFSRDFRAPRALVYRLLTQAEHLAQWFGPRAFTSPVCAIDLRPGGSYRITMRGPDGTDYPLSGRYLEVRENELLVMTCSTGGHPPEWQEHLRRLAAGRADAGVPVGQDLHWTITFADRGNGTRLTIVSRFASAADLEAHMKMGMAEGWAQSLDKLEHLLPGH